MAIIIHCPFCHQPLPEMRQECQQCGSELPTGVVYALAAAFGTPQMPPPSLSPERHPPVHQQGKPSTIAASAHVPTHDGLFRPWLAAILSLLCGLGQIYNGQIVKGMLLMILATAALVSFSLFIGKLLAILVWSYAILDAFWVARRTTRVSPSHKP